MFEGLKHIWKPGKLVIIQLELQPDGVQVYAGKFSRNTGKNTKQLPSASFGSVAEVLEKFGKSRAYVIHVQGIGVLTRKVEALAGFRDQLIVSGEKDDFHFTSYNDGRNVAVSFFRKTLLENYLAPLLEAKVFLLGISCGPIPLFLLLGENGETSFDFHVKMRDGQIADLSRNEQAQSRGICNGIFLEKNEAFDQAVLCSYTTPAAAYTGAYTAEQTTAALQEYAQFSQFRFFGLALVSLILILLLGNRMYIGRLNQEIAQLETDLSLSNENLALLDRMNLEKKRKEQLISSSGANATEFIAFYLDKTGESVPKAINLVEMYVFPLAEKLKQKHKVEINQEKIEILGNTASSEVLDDWIEKLNRFDWVKSVELMNYQKIENAQAEFKIIITLEA
jgi:Tfp pilus assembly protein PilN